MTDSQQLVAEYVRNGSDTAFRELVTRYVDLVYSTALRLVNGRIQSNGQPQPIGAPAWP